MSNRSNGGCGSQSGLWSRDPVTSGACFSVGKGRGWQWLCIWRKSYPEKGFTLVGSRSSTGLSPHVTARYQKSRQHQRHARKQKVTAPEAKPNGHTTFMMGSKVAQCGLLFPPRPVENPVGQAGSTFLWPATASGSGEPSSQAMLERQFRVQKGYRNGEVQTKINLGCLRFLSGFKVWMLRNSNWKHHLANHNPKFKYQKSIEIMSCKGHVFEKSSHIITNPIFSGGRFRFQVQQVATLPSKRWLPVAAPNIKTSSFKIWDFECLQKTTGYIVV